MTNFSRNFSSNRRGKAVDALLRSPFNVLHCLLCIAALTLGFRLSREALLVVGSHKPSLDTLKSIRKAYTDTGSHSEVALGFPYVKDDRRNLTSHVLLRTPSSVELKSSRVHVGRHEILIRSWPHPDPLHTFLADQLLSHIQDEQRRTYALKERKQLLVITTTHVRTFQALHLTGLIHTLCAIPSPLIWIVVEAGGVSSETAALLVNSQLSYHHLGIDVNTLDDRNLQQVETLLRLKGLRFIEEQQLDGVVLFADDSNTYSFDYFEEAQRVDWIGIFSFGVLSPPSLSGLSKENANPIQDGFMLSKATLAEQGLDDSDSTRVLDTSLRGAISSFQDEGSRPILALPLETPVCNSSGHIIGWYSPSPLRNNGSGMGLEWTAFALNARIFWKDYERPTWIKDWAETLGKNQSLIESPLAFVKDTSFVQPLGNCGKDVLMWWLRVEARVDSKFPSRWTISPPLDVVVPSKRTPWPEAHLASSPPPPSKPPPVLGNEHMSIRVKDMKGGRGKQRLYPAKHDRSKKVSAQV